jgi:hypothetical protein
MASVFLNATISLLFLYIGQAANATAAKHYPHMLNQHHSHRHAHRQAPGTLLNLEAQEANAAADEAAEVVCHNLRRQHRLKGPKPSYEECLQELRRIVEPATSVALSARLAGQKFDFGKAVAAKAHFEVAVAAPAPSPAAAAPAAPWGMDRLHMDGVTKSLPAQGFQGPFVKHSDMESFSGDWQEEYGPNNGVFRLETLCSEHPENKFCRHHFRSKASTPLGFKGAPPAPAKVPAFHLVRTRHVQNQPLADDRPLRSKAVGAFEHTVWFVPAVILLAGLLA